MIIIPASEECFVDNTLGEIARSVYNAFRWRFWYGKNALEDENHVIHGLSRDNGGCHGIGYGPERSLSIYPEMPEVRYA